jgi:glycosyltransferase involved in cell wall biosynthesis
MKVLYDHQAYSMQQYGGVSRYFHELINHLYSKIDIDLKVFFSNNKYIAGDERFPHRNFLSNFNFKGKIHLLRNLNNLFSKKHIKRQDFDVFHPSYYCPYFLPLIGSKPFVLTVHDMTHELFPEEFDKFDFTAKWKDILVKKANKIIAVSENTKKDLIKFKNVNPDKINVVYHGHSFNSKYGDSVNINLPEKYLLYVGSRKQYKNFTNFIKAFENINKRDRSVKMIAFGGGNFSPGEQKLFDELDLKENVFYYSGNDQTLAKLYKNAMAFVFPSLYEGFGIPVLEAFANQCPVVLSKKGSLPEVGGNDALYFNPYETEDITQKLEMITNNKNLREELKSRGNQRLKLFSWEKTAKNTLEIYKSLLK